MAEERKAPFDLGWILVLIVVGLILLNIREISY